MLGATVMKELIIQPNADATTENFQLPKHETKLKIIQLTQQQP